MDGKYEALDVANYILLYCSKNNLEMDNLKLQKVLYYIQGSFLVQTKKPCFIDDVEAWVFGPTVQKVYSEFYCHVSNNLVELVEIEDNWDCFIEDLSDRQMIEDIIIQYADTPFLELYIQTTDESPWINNFVQGKQNKILNEDILNWFIENIDSYKNVIN